MSTPPPIAAPVDPNAPSKAGLSEPQRIIDTFIAPRKTFEDLKRNSSWWVPWLLSAIFTLAFSVVAVQKLDMTDVVRKNIERSKLAQRQMESLSPEQRERAIVQQGAVTKVFFFIAPVFGILAGLIVAAVLMGVFNFGFASEVSYGRSLAIVFYSFLPGIIWSVLMIVSLLVSSDLSNFDLNNAVATNLGFFMDPMGNKFLYSLASRLDVISIWIAVLMGIGFSTCSAKKLSPGTGITAVLATYGVFSLIRAALAAAF